jgi:protein-arginine kinase activator protein McsA
VSSLSEQLQGMQGDLDDAVEREDYEEALEIALLILDIYETLLEQVGVMRVIRRTIN